MNNGTIEYTSISELIEELTKLKDRCGDIPVCIDGRTPIFISSRPYFYDGGYYAQDASDPWNTLSSRDGGGCRENMPDNCVDLESRAYEDCDKFNGRLAREIDPDSFNYLDMLEQKERQIFHGQIVRYIWPKEKDPDGFYRVTAYLDSGESAKGACMKDAREALTALYTGKNPK